MKTLILNITTSEILSFVNKNYLIANFTQNMQTFKIEVIDGISGLSEIVAKFKKFDKLSVAQKTRYLIFGIN